MTDKIDKFLAKLSKKEFETVDNILVKLKAGEVQGLDLTRLKGPRNVYRVRKGRIRIIFKRDEGQIRLLSVSKRNEKTYKNL